MKKMAAWTTIVWLLLVTAFGLPGALWADGEAGHVWEKVEIVLEAQERYDNPYTQVAVWVDLTGPGFAKRCYGFWDGGKTYRVRVLATVPGAWRWVSGSNQDDVGLNGREGTFRAVAWSAAEKAENPCRRGMVRATANGHAFEHADGTPYFLLGDTWWSVGTFRYPWRDGGEPLPPGPDAGFQDYVRFRKEQGYNCIAMIAAFPNWANDGHPATLRTSDGTVLRSAWKQAPTRSAKGMHDERGNLPFFFPGRVPGFEEVFPDLDRINPAYFQSVDRKIDYLNRQGFMPFIEVSRRDIGRAWKKYYDWPASYTRYIQYIWSRYQANLCLFSPIHFDSPGNTIASADWNVAANAVIDQYGPPPFGTPVSCNSNPSSLGNFGHTDNAKWLTFHQIGNWQRTHHSYARLTEIFEAEPPVPGINGEPYYAGMERPAWEKDMKSVGQAGAPGGSLISALYCRSAMYGSVLSGGLGGHIYGAGGWDGGMWGGNVEPEAKTHIWEVVRWESADQMRHLARFILSEGRKYQDLVPNNELLDPHRSGPERDFVGWACAARTDDKHLFMLYFEMACPRATLSGALPNAAYNATWFNPRTGQWQPAQTLTANPKAQINLPPFPEATEKSEVDSALKLTLKNTP